MIIYWYENYPFFDMNLGFKFQKPIPIKINHKSFIEKNDEIQDYSRCPAYQDYIKNLYGISIPFDYNLVYDKEPETNKTIIGSNYYDQQFFNNFVIIRSIPNKLISIQNAINFIPESDDLFISQLPAHFEKNNFTQNTILIPGTFNVGKWPRGVETAFHMLNDIRMTAGDILFYVKFHTDEKIIFKRIFKTQKMTLLMNNYFTSPIRFINNLPKSLSYYYDLIKPYKKFKKLLIEEAKQNLLE